MNYGGIDAPPPIRRWGSWQIHYRFRMINWAPGIGEENYEYQYAVDVFDLMKKDSQ